MGKAAVRSGALPEKESNGGKGPGRVDSQTRCRGVRGAQTSNKGEDVGELSPGHHCFLGESLDIGWKGSSQKTGEKER